MFHCANCGNPLGRNVRVGCDKCRKNFCVKCFEVFITSHGGAEKMNPVKNGIRKGSIKDMATVEKWYDEGVICDYVIIDCWVHESISHLKKFAKYNNYWDGSTYGGEEMKTKKDVEHMNSKLDLIDAMSGTLCVIL